MGSDPNGIILKFVLEETAGVGFGAGGNLLGGAADYKMASALTAFGAQVNNVVGTLYHIHVVLYDDYGVAATYQGIKRLQQFADIVEMQAGGGLIEYEYGGIGLLKTQEIGQFYALALTARQGR